MTESANNTMVTKGVGIITDATGALWTLSTIGDVLKNNVHVAGGSGSDKMGYVSHSVWAHDQTNTPDAGWFQAPTWVVGPKANVLGQQVIVPPVTQPPIVLNDTLVITIAGTTTNNVNPKFVVSLGANGDIAIPPTSVTQNADNVNWQTFTFKGNWPSPQRGFLTFVNAAPNRELVVKSISFDANTYSGNGVVVLSQQGQSASFSR